MQIQKNTWLTVASWALFFSLGTPGAQADAGAASLKDHYIFYFVVDGGSGLRISKLLEGCPARTPELQNICRHFLGHGGGGIMVDHAVTVWPSSSLPAHVASLTGAYPSTTYIGGQRGFERYRTTEQKVNVPDRRADYFVRSYIGLEYTELNPVDLSQGVYTLFEQFRDYASENISEQTDRRRVHYSDGFTSRLTTRSQFPNPSDAISALNAKDRIIEVFGQLRDHPENSPNVPHIFTINLPELDHHTHSSLTGEQAQMHEVTINMDKAVGTVLGALAGFPEIYRKSIFVLTADHGMGPVDNHFDFVNALAAQTGVSRLKPHRMETADIEAAATAMVNKRTASQPSLDITTLFGQALGGFYHNGADVIGEWISGAIQKWIPGKVKSLLGAKLKAATKNLPDSTFESELTFNGTTNHWEYRSAKDYDPYQLYAVWGGNSDGLVYLQGLAYGKDPKVPTDSRWDIPVSYGDITHYPILKRNSEGKVISVERWVNWPNLMLDMTATAKGGATTKPIALAFYPATERGTFFVQSRDGTGKIRVITHGAHPGYCYSYQGTGDPLGYLHDNSFLPPARPLPSHLEVGDYGESLRGSMVIADRDYIKGKIDANGEACLSDQEWLDHTIDAWYPDALKRIHMSFGINAHSGPGWHQHGTMSADIGLIPIPGWDLMGVSATTGDLGEMKDLQGSHGGLDYTHSIVPLYIATHDPELKARLQAAQPARTARIVDWVPTVVRLLGEKIKGNVDGRNLLTP